MLINLNPIADRVVQNCQFDGSGILGCFTAKDHALGLEALKFRVNVVYLKGRGGNARVAYCDVAVGGGRWEGVG